MRKNRKCSREGKPLITFFFTFILEWWNRHEIVQKKKPRQISYIFFFYAKWISQVTRLFYLALYKCKDASRSNWENLLMKFENTVNHSESIKAVFFQYTKHAERNIWSVQQNLPRRLSEHLTVSDLQQRAMMRLDCLWACDAPRQCLLPPSCHCPDRKEAESEVTGGHAHSRVTLRGRGN